MFDSFLLVMQPHSVNTGWQYKQTPLRFIDTIDQWILLVIEAPMKLLKLIEKLFNYRNLDHISIDTR